VSPLEIEEELRSYPEVVDCLAFGLPHPLYGSIPVAALVLRDACPDGAGIDMALQRVSVSCRQNLGMVAPRRLFVVAELPRGATGKPLRRVVRERFAREQY
jgi:acyl-coenzyme A synthetase/AMP-(fatty) acid ligase